MEALDWMGTKLACVLRRVHSTMPGWAVDKMPRKESQASEYGKFGGRICTRRWIYCAPSLSSIPTLAWYRLSFKLMTEQGAYKESRIQNSRALLRDPLASFIPRPPITIKRCDATSTF